MRALATASTLLTATLVHRAGERAPRVRMESSDALAPQDESEMAGLDALFATTEDEFEPDPNTPSHRSLERDEEGEPMLDRFVYVDEHSCIGCTYCATTARSTFMMEPDHGRARVYSQGGNSDDLIAEAIDSCPVNCIHYVSLDDLVILEQERAGQFINNAARLRSQQEATAYVPPTAAKAFQSGSMRCNNCPGRGCRECPMYGVGENPLYLKRLEEREQKRQRSGEAARAAESARRSAMVSDFFGASEAEADDDATTSMRAGGEESTDGAPSADALDAKLDALFGAYGVGEDEQED